MRQRMSRVLQPPMNEIGSRAGEDLTSPNVHGDAHHVVRGNGCRRGCRCSHLSSTSSLSFEIGSGAGGGVNLRLAAVRVGSSSVQGTKRAHGEQLEEGIARSAGAGSWGSVRKTPLVLVLGWEPALGLIGRGAHGEGKAWSSCRELGWGRTKGGTKWGMADRREGKF